MRSMTRFRPSRPRDDLQAVIPLRSDERVDDDAGRCYAVRSAPERYLGVSADAPPWLTRLNTDRQCRYRTDQGQWQDGS